MLSKKINFHEILFRPRNFCGFDGIVLLRITFLWELYSWEPLLNDIAGRNIQPGVKFKLFKTSIFFTRHDFHLGTSHFFFFLFFFSKILGTLELVNSQECSWNLKLWISGILPTTIYYFIFLSLYLCTTFLLWSQLEVL